MALSPFARMPVKPGVAHRHAPDAFEVNRANAFRNQPGYGGVVEGRTTAGYHMLTHAGAVEGFVLADYKLVRQVSTQSGQRATVLNLYRVEYMSG